MSSKMAVNLQPNDDVNQIDDKNIVSESEA